MSTRKVSFPGKCQFCKQTFSKKKMAGHLESCEARKEAAPKRQRKTRPQKTGIYHIFVEGYNRPNYWIYLEIRADAGLHDLYPEFWIIQRSWLFSLLILKKKAKVFTEDVVISRAFIKAFPEIALEVDEIYTSDFEYITHCYSYRFLERFCEFFGFLTVRGEKEDISAFDRFFIKTTPLFEKYFKWNERKAN